MHLAVDLLVSLLLSPASAATTVGLRGFSRDDMAISLDLKRGYAVRRGKSCSVRSRWTYYHAGGRVFYEGQVTPAPNKRFNLKISVQRCLDGRFSAVKTTSASGAPNGSFRGSFQVVVPSDCLVRAVYFGASSRNAYFRVR